MIELTVDARPFRRAVGALPWMAFEEFCFITEINVNGDRVAPCGLRELAERLNVNKDTAARAVSVLLHHGVVERVTRPKCGYRIVALPTGVTMSSLDPVEHRNSRHDTAFAASVELDRISERARSQPSIPVVVDVSSSTIDCPADADSVDASINPKDRPAMRDARSTRSQPRIRARDQRDGATFEQGKLFG